MSANKFQNEPNACAIDLKTQAMIRLTSPSTGETMVARIWPAKDGVVHVELGYIHSPGTSEASGILGDKVIECNSLRSVREIYDVAPQHSRSFVGLMIRTRSPRLIRQANLRLRYDFVG